LNATIKQLICIAMGCDSNSSQISFTKYVGIL